MSTPTRCPGDVADSHRGAALCHDTADFRRLNGPAEHPEIHCLGLHPSGQLAGVCVPGTLLDAQNDQIVMSRRDSAAGFQWYRSKL